MSESNWGSVLYSKILANHFKELCQDFLPPYKEASVWMNRKKAELNGQMIFFLTKTGKLIQEKKIDEDTFKSEFKKIKSLDILKIEIIWYLEFFRIMTLNEFLQFHECNNNEEIILHIAQQVLENMIKLKSNPSEVRKKMLFYYLKLFLESSKFDRENRKICYFEIQLNLIIENLKQYLSSEENFETETNLEISLLTELLNNPELDSDLIKLFFYRILIALLEGSQQAMKSVIITQEKMKNNVKNRKIFKFYVTISKHCDCDFMVKLLENKLLETSNEINWNHMLCFISFLGIHYTDGWSKLKTLCNSIIKTAFQKLNSNLLLYGFLIGRQGCFEKVNFSFPSYLQWFGSTISSESRRLLNTKNACDFFFSFLTEIFPHDSTYYSKVHINKVPWVPIHCQSILHDYVQLVKTHLDDLNVSTELGICDNTTTKSAAIFDVENVIKHFERTNDILNSVFQASMFCKDYYEKKFLVELLSKFEGKKSARHKLIMKLHSLGKIPNSIFKVYKSLEKKNK